MCDNTIYHKSDYEDLWAILPSSVKNTTNNTFVLDMRNRAIMGADSNVTANQLGKTQNDTTAVNGLSIGKTDLSHTHNYTYQVLVASPAGPCFQGTPGYIGGATSGTTQGASVTMNHDHSLNGDTETRPKNIRWNYIIKAKP